jgi:hypothetical protein
VPNLAKIPESHLRTKETRLLFDKPLIRDKAVLQDLILTIYMGIIDKLGSKHTSKILINFFFRIIVNRINRQIYRFNSYERHNQQKSLKSSLQRQKTHSHCDPLKVGFQIVDFNPKVF